MDYYAGRVHTIVYEDPPNAFYIMVMVLDSTMKGVTVKGHVPGLTIEKGTWFGFEANWVHHAKFGKQLSISRAPVLKSGWDPDTASAMLQSHGVSEFLCDQIRQVFDDDQFLQVLEDADRLEEVPGVSDITAAHIVERWQSVIALFKALEFLNDLGLPRAKVRQVWEVFEDDAIEVLSKNPWALVEVDGIKFDQADEVARKLGLPLDSPDRASGAVLYACKTQRDFGHLYMQTGVLFNGVRALVPNADKANLGRALVGLNKSGRIVLDKETRPGTLAIYDPWHHQLEVDSALGLALKLEQAKFAGEALDEYLKALGSVGPDTEAEVEDASDLDVVVKTAVEEWGRQVRVTLTDKQEQGVINALLHPVSVLTGLPGTGKTTSLRAVVNVLQDAEVPFLLCAPTGIAAKRLTAVTGAQAYTIHRAFAAKGFGKDKRETVYAGIVGKSQGSSKSSGEGEAWEFGPGRPHPAQVVIIDEASMVDQHLLYRLLTCTSPSCRLVFVGDHAQLPSVGPGNVLKDMIASGQFPVIKLTEIFRQKNTSDIIFAAHDIHAGKVPNIKGSSEFILIQVDSDDDALEVILKLSQKLSVKQRDFQVLSPRHAGMVGVTNLNAQLRELLNPGSPGLSEVKLGNGVVRKGDRVMVIKNNYELGVFNGDVGEVARIDRKDKKVQVKIYGATPLFVSFPFREMSRHVRMAYACTVHKCVAGATLVATDGGLVPISELAVGVPVGRTKSLEQVVAGRRGWVTVDQVFSGGAEPTLKVATRGGYHLEGSHRHPVLVATGSGYIWKKLPEVSVGDVVVLRRGVGNQLTVPVSTAGFTPGGQRRRIGRYPLDVGEELAWLLGLFVGDGNYTDREDGRVELYQYDPQLLVVVRDLCRELFGVRPTLREKSVYFHGRLVREFLLWCGLGYTKAPDKQVPWVVLRSPSRVQAAFLRGLFDTDGGVSRLIHFTTASWELADGVHQLLLSLGVVSKLEPLGPSAYRVSVTGCGDKRRFQRLIGFTIEVKKAKLGALVAKATPSKSNVGLIPQGHELAASLRSKLRARGGRNYPEVASVGRLLSRTICGAPLRVSHLDVLRRGVPDLEIVEPELHRIWKEGLFFDPVVEIVPGESEVYDLHVDDEDHAFIGHGFVNHNSQGLEYDMIVMPIMDNFRHQLQRNLLYTAVTRARQKVVLVGTPSALAKAVANDREDQRNTLFPDRLSAVLGSNIPAPIE